MQKGRVCPNETSLPPVWPASFARMTSPTHSWTTLPWYLGAFFHSHPDLRRTLSIGTWPTSTLPCEPKDRTFHRDRNCVIPANPSYAYAILDHMSTTEGVVFHRHGGANITIEFDSPSSLDD